MRKSSYGGYLIRYPLLLILGTVLLVSLPLITIHSDYLNVADCDLVYLEYGYLFYGHGPINPAATSHPGYILIWLLAVLIKLLYYLNLIPIGDYQNLSNVMPFKQIFVPLIYYARFTSIFLSLIFYYTYFAFLKVHKTDKNITYIASVMLASTSGLHYQSLVIRPELLATYFSMICFFLMVLFVNQDKVMYKHTSMLIGIGFFAYFAMLTKIQVVLLFAFFPFIALIFGKTCTISLNADVILKEKYKGIVPILIITLALILLATGTVFFYKFLADFGIAGIIKAKIHFYQVAFYGYIFLAILLYNYLYCENSKYSLFVYVFILTGITISYLVVKYGCRPYLYGYFYFTILNFMDVLTTYSSFKPNETMLFLIGMTKKLFFDIIYLRKGYSYPLNLVYLFTIILALYILAKKQTNQFIRILSLIVFAMSVDILNSFRNGGINPQYIIFSQWIIVYAFFIGSSVTLSITRFKKIFIATVFILATLVFTLNVNQNYSLSRSMVAKASSGQNNLKFLCGLITESWFPITADRFQKEYCGRTETKK